MKREIEKSILSIALPTIEKVRYLGELINRIQINHPETKSKIERVALNQVSVDSAKEHDDAILKEKKVELDTQTEDFVVKIMRIIRALKNLKNRRYFLKKC
jgi:hypothetical protein